MTKEASDKPEPSIKKLPISFSFGMELKSIVKKLEQYNGSVFIVCHNDADGLCGGAVMAKALSRAGIFFRLKSISRLNRDIVDELANENMDYYIFVDIGSGYVELVESLVTRTGAQVVVLDHHRIKGESSKFIQVNCNNHGIDGSFDMSGSMMAFVFACTMDLSNYDLIDVALAGAIGDKQDIFGFTGQNKKFVDLALQHGFLVKERNIDIYGDTINDALTNTFDPFFKGISGRPRSIAMFLADLDIPLDMSLESLEIEKKKSLNSALVIEMIRSVPGNSTIQNFVKDRYYSSRINMYLGHLATVVNACGKQGKWSLGIAYILDSENYSKDALSQASAFNGKLMKKLVELEGGFQEKENFQYFTGEEDDHCGTVAGVAIRYISAGNFPLLGLTARKNDTMDISARGTRALVEQGLDLSSAMSEVCAMVGGQGGGHPVASGGTIPLDTMDEFLTQLDIFLSRPRN